MMLGEFSLQQQSPLENVGWRCDDAKTRALLSLQEIVVRG